MRRLYAHSSMAALMAAACFAPDAGSASALPADAAAPAADTPKAAPGKVKKVHMVWCGPGHSTYGIGMMVRATPDVADGLRNNGQARIATADEVTAYADRKTEIPDLG